MRSVRQNGRPASEHRENMMGFRLHSLLAMLLVIFLLCAWAPAQQTPPAQENPPAAGQQAPPAPANSEMQEAVEAPIEPVLSGPYPVMSRAAEERGRQVFEMFNRGQGAQIWANMSEGLKRATERKAKQDKFIEFNKRLHERMGTEAKMVEENIVPSLVAPDTVYSRLSSFERFPAVQIMSIITINQRGQIDGFTINRVPEYVAEGRFAGYSDLGKYKLPFGDEWLVYYGGRTPFQNAYSVSDDQRFALDFVYLKNGRMFSGHGGFGSKNTDYYCFGQPILAPADGKVVKAEGGYNDNPPARGSGDPPDGNIVSIFHPSAQGGGETSVMNHLKQNSIKVKTGDEVKQGQEVAECGNSGMGGVPHLHLQLEKGVGTVVPAQFVDYIADGKPVASGEPKRGQMVKNAPVAAAATTAPSTSAAPPVSK